MIEKDEEAIELFKEILKFETISSKGPINNSYNLCGEWIQKQLQKLNLKVNILEESKENKPIIVAEWEGSNQLLSCIFLNSHYDVVPIIESSWNFPPFEGYLHDGKIYGRGTQDMKCVVIQYIIAIKRLKESGYIPLRTIRLSFVPDEEIGGIDGMKVLMGSKWFSEKSIAIALDEGLASEDEHYSIFYGERLPWWLNVSYYSLYVLFFKLFISIFKQTKKMIKYK